MTLVEVSNIVKYQFAYLQEAVLKQDFLFCFNRPTLKQVVELCHLKDR